MRPTPRLKRVALKRRYTWSCNLQGKQLIMLPLSLVGSYSTFSSLPQDKLGRLFSSLPSCLTNISYFKSAAPCVVRTFLPAKTNEATDLPTSKGKIIKNFSIFLYLIKFAEKNCEVYRKIKI
jgi:hypothetical protein